MAVKRTRGPAKDGLARAETADFEAAPERIDHARPLREQVYAIVRRAILTGEFAPGATLDEKAIALALGVSRTPVREAVKKLSDENLVAVKAQSATIVAAIEPGLIREAFLIRRALEVENISQAVDRMSESHKDRMDELYLLHEHAIQRKRYVDAIAWDDAFHRYISEISGLPRLWKAIEISKAQLDRCRLLSVPRPGRAQATLDQHRQIIVALAARDKKLSRRMMSDHLENAYRDIMTLLGSTATAGGKDRQPDLPAGSSKAVKASQRMGRL
jgi:GntR family transcriptional regulator, rspAB operon transcriptional repressor